MLKWQYERDSISLPSQWQSVLTGTQQELSQFLELTPLSRCCAPLLPGQHWTCWAMQHLPMHHCPCPACAWQLWACLPGQLETLAFMELCCFQTGIGLRFIDALIELSEVRERHVHSTPPLLKLGTPESGPAPGISFHTSSCWTWALQYNPAVLQRHYQAPWFDCTLSKLLLLCIPGWESASSVTLHSWNKQ